MSLAATSISNEQAQYGKKPVSWRNLAIGAIIQVFEVSTLGQPFEVLKTHMAGRRRRV